jgi:hypothetical protein
MELIYTEDTDLIREIMTDNDIWEKISDGSSKEDFECRLNNNIIALAIKADDVIGLNVYTKREDGIYFHPMILKQYRREYAREGVKMGIEWYNKNIGKPLLCEIPTMHKSTINLAKKMGFIPIESDVMTKMRLV